MLKQSICLLLVPLALAIGAEKASAPKPAAKQSKAAAKPNPDAVKTPFGIFTSGGSAAETRKGPVVPSDMTVTEDGDTLQFSRKTPFGAVRWDRKKSELTELELAAWEKAKASKTAPPEEDKKKDKE